MLTNGAALGGGLILVIVWALPTLSPDSFGFFRQVVLIYLGTAGLVGIVVELLPLGIGTVLTTRSVGIEARRAAFPVTAAWLVGGVLGVGIAALVLPGFLALLGAPAGALIGAVLGGPPLARRLVG
ncbi:MAG: hypothetical protein ABEI31_09910 [Halodesulfurarchaeum sp.]